MKPGEPFTFSDLALAHADVWVGVAVFLYIVHRFEAWRWFQ